MIKKNKKRKISLRVSLVLVREIAQRKSAQNLRIVNLQEMTLSVKRKRKNKRKIRVRKKIKARKKRNKKTKIKIKKSMGKLRKNKVKAKSRKAKRKISRQVESKKLFLQPKLNLLFHNSQSQQVIKFLSINSYFSSYCKNETAKL